MSLGQADVSALKLKPKVRHRDFKKVKSSAQTTRQHVFKTFSERIARIDVQPVHRSHKSIVYDAEQREVSSFFKAALERWHDRNLSDLFTAFARKIIPLCNSLAQVLHHSDRLVELLLEHIKQADKYSAEPLCDLLAQLAHDLGERFEKYFECTVKVVSRVAATHKDVEVIEWSFGSLAWLFKYLSRLLVPNLVPVFDLISPLLGTERQKSFVSRFAAESLSFLIRKAGDAHRRGNDVPLKLIISHVSRRENEQHSRGRDEDFRQGLMHLFIGTIQGAHRGFHSSAEAVLQELLSEMYCQSCARELEGNRPCPQPLELMVMGVITAAIHHSDKEKFEPLARVIVTHINIASSNVRHLGLSCRLLFCICGVRKGNRISEWQPICSTFTGLFDSIQELDTDHSLVSWEYLSSLAVVLCYGELDVIGADEQLLHNLSHGFWGRLFVPFCILLADLSIARFEAVLLPHFKSFFTSCAHEYVYELCIVLPSLEESGMLSAGSLQPSQRLETMLLKCFKTLESSTHSTEESERIVHCHAMLKMAQVCRIDHAKQVEFCVTLEKLIQKAFKNKVECEIDEIDKMALFASGTALQYLIATTGNESLLRDIWPQLCDASLTYNKSLPFWHAFHALATQKQECLLLEGAHMDTLHKALTLCLTSSSHDMRLVAIHILLIIKSKIAGLPNIISMMQAIEQTPPTFENQRNIAMRIGQLAESYSTVCSDKWMWQIVPAFCFGLLHVRLATVWDNVCSALKVICESKRGEELVCSFAFEWLNTHELTIPESQQANKDIAPGRYVTEFECTNLTSLSRLVMDIPRAGSEVELRIKMMYDKANPEIPLYTSFSRTQSLRLLKTLPHIAEKRSRMLVPVLLSWTNDRSVDDADTLSEAHMAGNTPGDWKMADKKLLLSLFAEFTNPKVLHRANDVYEALQVLLCNGDVEIQKTAFSALLTWKIPAILSHQVSLRNLLDDARFREELPLFLADGRIREADVEYVLPIIVRMLYGRVITGNRGLEAKRKAVFVGLKNAFGDNAIFDFLHIALGPLGNMSKLQGSGLTEDVLQTSAMTSRKQIGLLNLVEDLIATLQVSFAPFIAKVINPILYCAIRATRDLSSRSAMENGSADHVLLEASLIKTIRQRSLQLLARLFELCPGFPWQPYIGFVVTELIKPRLDKLPIETAQTVSGLLRLFAAWSKSQDTVMFLGQGDCHILPKVIECIEISSAKDEVKLFVLDNILQNVFAQVAPEAALHTVDSSELQQRIHLDIIEPHTNAILTVVGQLLKQRPRKELLDSGVQAIANLAPLVKGGKESRNMVEIATFLLQQPSRFVNHRTKLGLLRIIRGFITQCDPQAVRDVLDHVYNALCPLFAFARENDTRSLLCDTLNSLDVHEKHLQPIAELCHSLNSFAKGRLEEPDFDRRFQAFNKINQDDFTLYTLAQWKPLVYNMLFFIKDEDELSIRANASLSLRRFIDVSVTDSFKDFISKNVLPCIHRGAREQSELVRVEFLAVMEHLIKVHSDWQPIADLKVLISDQEETSFFSNILHIQGHRRIRALRRLASYGSQLRSETISHFLVPLLEHFVFQKADDDNSASLLGETIRSLTALAIGLEWPQFRSLCKRYIGYFSSKEDMQKSIIKLVAGLLRALQRAGREKGYVDQSRSDEDKDRHDIPLSKLAETLPLQEKLAKDLCDHVLPDLTQILHKKEESTVSLRVPIAIGVVDTLLVLPEQEIEARLPAILLDLCHILKSRAQESRDMSRNTLSDIAVLMGATHLGFIIKALRTALQRGYQLHVLSFTLHHILVRLTGQLQSGDIDYCLSDIVEVIMDDTFGAAGQEKEAEDYISAMKEVKSRKSFDSMDLIARTCTPASLIKLVAPLKNLLTEKLDAKMVHKIDELLRRIGLGMLQNTDVNGRDTLTFCYELIRDAHTAGATPQTYGRTESKNLRYLIQRHGAAKSGSRVSPSSYRYKMTRFGLDLLRIVLRKYDELRTPQNVAGFLPILGEAIVQGQEEVQVSAIRLLTLIVKLPIAELDTNCPVYIDEAIRAIKGAPSSNTELAQASLKLLSAILGERPLAQIKEKEIGHLLKRITPDLDQPDRSGVTFGFLKAIMNRHIENPELYEVMEKVAEIMITSHTKSARDVARSHYFQFLMSYTQSERRFKKQIEFLLKNLQYEHMEGRQSVMEALDLIVTKALPRFPKRTQFDYHGIIFLPLVNSLANDDANSCRELAGLLLRRLFQHASDERLLVFKDDLRPWLRQDENAGLKRLAIQCWGLYFDTLTGKDHFKDLAFVLDNLDLIIDDCLTRRDSSQWELMYLSLTLISKIVHQNVDLMLSPAKESLWTSIQNSNSYPHVWVKLKAAELIEMYFAHLAMSNKEHGLRALPLRGAHGLQLGEQSMLQMAHVFMRNLLDPHVTEELCTQIIKNLSFLLRCFAVNESRWQWRGEANTEPDEAASDSAPEGEEAGNVADAVEISSAPQTAIHHLMTRLSSILRADKSTLNVRSAVISLLESIITKFPLEPLATSLPHVLSTLNTLVDPSTTVPHESTAQNHSTEAVISHKSIREKARETLNVLQSRMDTQEYIKIMNDVQRLAKEKREERRRKRKMDAVVDPEKWGKEKRRKNEVKRIKRKEQGMENRGWRRGW